MLMKTSSTNDFATEQSSSYLSIAARTSSMPATTSPGNASPVPPQRVASCLHRALNGQTHLAVLLLDSAGNIAYASPSASKLTGFEEKELLGKNFWEELVDSAKIRMPVKKEYGLFSGSSSLLETEGEGDGPKIEAKRVKKKEDGTESSAFAIAWLRRKTLNGSLLPAMLSSSTYSLPQDDLAVQEKADDAEKCNRGSLVALLPLDSGFGSLSLAEEAFQAIQNSHGVLEIDIGGRILWANKNIAGWLEYEPEDLVGLLHCSLVPEIEKNSCYAELWNNLRMGKFQTGEFMRLTKTGKEVWVKGSYNPIRGPNGNVVKVVKTALNITHEKEAALNMEQRIKAIDKSSSVIEFDLDGNILTANENYLHLIKYSLPEIIGKHHSIFVEPGYAQSEEYHQFWQDLKHGAFKSGEFERLAKNGERVWIHGSYNPITDLQGRPYKVVKFAYDVTERKRADAAVSKARFEAEIAKQSASMRSQFLANMSHEIRTPMNGVLGMCNLLASTATEEQRKYIEVMQTCGDELLKLIDGILDLSKVDAGKMVLEPITFNLKEAIEDIVMLLLPKAMEKGISLRYVDSDSLLPSQVIADASRFKQILTNLVGNAVKFTEKGRVAISTRTTKSETNGRLKVEVFVMDTGIGIPPVVKDRIFSTFIQADLSTTRKYGGSGLGLAICKSLCQLMGGDIAVDSEMGQGSTFTFSILVDEVVSNGKAILKPKVGGSKLFDPDLGRRHPLRVLVAEDDAVNQLVAKSFLERFGYRMDLATNGLEVLKKVTEQEYDIIFMDCHMPELDGYEATKRLRKLYAGVPEPPKIIAMTASALHEDVKRCYDSGMDGFVSKPVDVRELAGVLSTCPRRRESTAAYKSNSGRAHAEEPQGSKSRIESSDLMIEGGKGNSPILDEEALLAHVNGLYKVFEEAIQVLIVKLPSYRERIRLAIDKQNAQELRISSHALKGALSQFFAEEAREAAAEMEEVAAGEAYSPSRAEYCFQRLEQAMDRLRPVLATWHTRLRVLAEGEA